MFIWGLFVFVVLMIEVRGLTSYTGALPNPWLCEERTLSCSSGWPPGHNPLTSTSHALRLPVCATVTGKHGITSVCHHDQQQLCF